MKISVGVVIYKNSIEELTTLLFSISAAKKYLKNYRSDATVEIFFCDNGDVAHSFFEELKEKTEEKFQVYQSGGNLGSAKAHNLLMKEAFEKKSLAYISVNPDGFFHYRCLEEFAKLSDEYNHCALIEAKIMPAEYAKFYDPETLETKWCSSACLWIPSEIFALTGGFDKEFFLYCDDVDFSWRVQEVGRKTLLCPTALFYHDFTQRTENPPLRHKQMLVGARHLAYKWNCNDFAHKMELQLFKRGLISSGAELPAPPQTTHQYTKKIFFGFAKKRW